MGLPSILSVGFNYLDNQAATGTVELDCQQIDALRPNPAEVGKASLEALAAQRWEENFPERFHHWFAMVRHWSSAEKKSGVLEVR